LALWTGQRQADLIRLTWMQYDGAKIRLAQSKSRRKKRVVIPVGAPPKAALDARKPDLAEGAILRNTFGEAWTTDGFKTSWGKALVRAGLGTRSALPRPTGHGSDAAALAGATVAEIAAITGHGLQDVERILQAHDLGGQVELAEWAIVKLDAKYGAGT
jgi:integrase